MELLQQGGNRPSPDININSGVTENLRPVDFNGQASFINCFILHCSTQNWELQEEFWNRVLENEMNKKCKWEDSVKWILVK